MGKIDFIQLVDCIFKNKDKYEVLEDQDKVDNFFIINRKFGVKYPLHCNLFNHKDVDKASVIDFWSIYFKSTKGIPQWYWAKSKTVKEKKPITNAERKLLIEFFQLNDSDIDFLIKNNLDEVKEELKKIKRFKNE